MNIEELAFENRKTLANLNRIDLLDIIEFLQKDRKQWINQFTQAHNESVEIQKENKQLKEKLDKYENPEDMTLFAMWCTEKVKDENLELKKQLEEINNFIKKSGFVNIEQVILNYCGLLTQEKEFIKYLEDEIKKEKEDLEHLCDLYKIPQKNNSTYKFVYSYINKIEKILQKYKEITQTKSDKSV